MVEVFLRMGSLVIIFQTGAVMLHFQETWLFRELGIPTPNFWTESLLHPISNSNTVPGCLPFAVSVVCHLLIFSFFFFSPQCSLCWYLQSWLAYVVLYVQLSAGFWRSYSLVHLERERQQQPLSAALTKDTMRTRNTTVRCCSSFWKGSL